MNTNQEPEPMKFVAMKMEPSLEAAVKADAAARGETFGEWMRKAARSRLSKEVRAQLPKSRGPGRPRGVLSATGGGDEAGGGTGTGRREVKFIIDIQDGLNELSALKAVMQVVKAGRISGSAIGIPHYCWASVDTAAGIEVSVRQKRDANSADSFVVRRAQGDDR